MLLLLGAELGVVIFHGDSCSEDSSHRPGRSVR
jgi:hypothetical protein